jgi:hypothetical protein
MRERYRRFLWAEDDFTLRETDFEPTPEQIRRGKAILEEAIAECIPKERIIFDPPV